MRRPAQFGYELWVCKVSFRASEQEAQIRELSVPQLEELGEALLDFADPADLVAWLENCR